MAEAQINVGVFTAHAPGTDPEPINALANAAIEEIRGVLDRETGSDWQFHIGDPMALSNDDPRRPSDFLDEASLRMVEGPFDMVIVVTDVTLTSRKQHVVAGLASPIARVAVVSLRKLRMSPRGEPMRSFTSPAVRLNTAALIMHLIGHMLGLGHTRAQGDVMTPFAFDPDRQHVPTLNAETKKRLEREAHALPDRELRGAGFFRMLLFHLVSAAHNAGQVLRALVRSRALLMPLSLPGLATAAVAPTIILVFTAEIWDVGLHMGNNVAWSSAVVVVLACTCYLIAAQNLLFPRKERRVITEHMAVVNVNVFLTMLLALAGLFIMIGLLMLFLETYVFPAGLIKTWPTLAEPVVTIWDKMRLAAFMSTVGVLTGALAGGMESRNLIRHLALFEDEP